MPSTRSGFDLFSKIARTSCALNVLAAAIHGRADVIVTYNLKDFPEEIVSTHRVSAQHPDEFLTHLLDLAPGPVLETIQRLRRSLMKPTVSVEEYLATLERHELPSRGRSL